MQIDLSNVVKYDSSTGQLEYNGIVVSGVSTMTFDQMEALTADELLRLHGLTVHINDVHSNSSGIGGSYIVRDSSPAGWAQVSGPMYFPSLDSCPAPASYPGWRYDVPILGVLKSNGIHHRPEYPYCLLGNVVTPVVVADGSKLSEYLPYPVQIPVDVNGKSLLQDGDYISLHHAKLIKTGSVGNWYRSLRIGQANDTKGSTPADATIDAGTVISAANTVFMFRQVDFKRVSATSLEPSQLGATGVWSVGAGGSDGAAITVTNLDNGVPTYLNVGAYLTSASDTNLTLKNCEVRLYRGY